MKITIPFIFIIPALFSAPLDAAPVIHVKDYGSPCVFTNKKVVLIQKGDRPEYADPKFDDSSWRRVSLPHTWNSIYPGWRGVCWYRIHVTFPDAPPTRTMGIRLGVIADVDETYLNGKLIGTTGVFPPHRRSAYDRERMYEIPADLIRPGPGNVVSIRVAGFLQRRNGPCKGDFVIAPYRAIQDSYLAREVAEAVFITLLIAVSMFFLFALYQQSYERGILFIALASLDCAIYFFTLTQSKYLVSDNFVLLKRIEYCSLFAAFPFIMESLTHFTARGRRFFHYIFYAISAAGILTVVASDDIILWQRVMYYAIMPSWAMPTIYCYYVLVPEYRTNGDARILLYTCIILTVAMVNDMLVHLGAYQFTRVLKYAFIVLFVTCAVLLRNRLFRLKRNAKAVRTEKGAVSDIGKNKIEEVISFIKANYIRDITRMSIARDLAMNPDYLNRIFKMHTGKSIPEFINQVRIEKARELLLDKNINVIDIAFAVGFESLSTFYRIFHKITGESPVNYRKKKFPGAE